MYRSSKKYVFCLTLCFLKTVLSASWMEGAAAAGAAEPTGAAEDGGSEAEAVPRMKAESGRDSGSVMVLAAS